MKWPWSKPKPKEVTDPRKLIFSPKQDITTYELAKVTGVLIQIRDQRWFRSDLEMWEDIQKLDPEINRHIQFRDPNEFVV